MGNGPLTTPPPVPQGPPGGSGAGAGPGMQGILQGMPGAPTGQPGATPTGPNPAAASPQPSPTIGTPGANQDTDQQAKITNMVDFALQDNNIAKKLSKTKKGKETLDKMGSCIIEGFEADELSRRDWCEKNTEWMNLALLIRENKSFPWPKASNVKYPLLATAAMQFSARAYPALVPSDGHIVKTKIIQKDPTDQIYQAAERIGQHMSFQLLERMDNWEEDMDKLLMTMAISGICFKKTYFSGVTQSNHSHIVYPENFVVNYYAKSLERAYRKSEILRYNDNEVLEKVNAEETFLDVDLSVPLVEEKEQLKHPSTGIIPPPPDESTPHLFIACHTFWDLDDDGYEEPYVITVHKHTKQVVRIVARWRLDDVKRNKDNKIIRIKPIEYFTAFPFIPNPDGSIYALGFGMLLGPLNEAVNSIINQLVDAGTLNNLASGFIGKGLRLRMGQTSLQPGEFKVVNATAEDLQKGVFVMPTKEPSSVLYQLMNLLITSGNQLASIAEIFVGKMPGQNTPATTTQETIQQGMAVFTAIYKRVYRSLAQEFKKLYFLNKINPDIVAEESKLAGMELQGSDYDLPDWIIIPGADPSGDSSTVRQSKLQQIGQLLQMGTIDPMWYTRQMLDANEIPNAQQAIKQPAPPPPDPKAQLLAQQGQQSAQEHQQTMAAGQQDVQNKSALAQIEEQKQHNKMTHEMTMQAMEMQGKQAETKHNMLKQTLDQHASTLGAMHDLLKSHVQAIQAGQQKQQGHVQDMVHTQQKHNQTITLAGQKARQDAKLKASQASKPK